MKETGLNFLTITLFDCVGNIISSDAKNCPLNIRFFCLKRKGQFVFSAVCLERTVKRSVGDTFYLWNFNKKRDLIVLINCITSIELKERINMTNSEITDIFAV